MIGRQVDQLSRLVDVAVHCFGAPRESELVARAYRPWEAIGRSVPHDAALGALSVNLLMAAGVADCDVVHTHTWYANFGGHLAKLVHGMPHAAECADQFGPPVGAAREKARRFRQQPDERCVLVERAAHEASMDAGHRGVLVAMRCHVERAVLHAYMVLQQRKRA